MKKIPDDSADRKIIIWTAVAGVVLLLSYRIISVPLVAEILRDIAIALLVAAIVMFTLELRNKRRTREDVDEFVRLAGESVIGAIYGPALPDTLFEAVKLQVFDQCFIRDNYRAAVEIHDLDATYLSRIPQSVAIALTGLAAAQPSSGRRVVLKWITSYRVTNVAAETLPYEVTMVSTIPSTIDLSPSTVVAALAIDGKSQLTGMVAPTSAFANSKSLHAGDALSVELEAYTLHLAEAESRWTSKDCSNGIEFSVLDASGDKDVLLTLSAPSSEVPAKPQIARKDPSTNRAALSVRQWLLPYQGVTMYWRPSGNASQGSHVPPQRADKAIPVNPSSGGTI